MENKWVQNTGKLIKSFDFKDFKQALIFINKVGELAESMNHHPKIINVYNQVTFESWTHEQEAISALDHRLAKEIDQKYKEL